LVNEQFIKMMLVSYCPAKKNLVIRNETNIYKKNNQSAYMILLR